MNNDIRVAIGYPFSRVLRKQFHRVLSIARLRAIRRPQWIQSVVYGSYAQLLNGRELRLFS